MSVTVLLWSAVLTLVVGPTARAQTALRTEGRSFMVYPSHVDSLWDKIDLYITTRSPNPVNVKIWTPKKPRYRGGVSLTSQVQAGQPLRQEVRADVSSHSQDKLQDGLLVTSDGDISVLVNNPGSQASGVTSILTHGSLAETYLVPALNRTRDAQTSILLGNPDGVNEIRVTLPAGVEGPSLHWKNTDYGPGQSFTLILHQHEFADIRQRDGGSGDLTGTLIHGQRALAVFYAAVFYPAPTGFSLPFAVDRGITIEHIPPVSSWGQRFVVSATPSRSAGDHVRVLAAQDNVHVQLGDNATQVTLARRGHFMETQLSPNQAFLLRADKPVLVMQYRFQFTADSAPFMFLVPAVDDYDVSYNVPVIFDLNPTTGSENHVVLMTHACHMDRVWLQLDPDPQGHSSGLVSKLSSWKRVEGGDYMVAEMSVGKGVVSISMRTSDDPAENEGVTVGGYIFGTGTNKAYATPLGLRSTPGTQVRQWPIPVINSTSVTEPVTEGRSRLVSRDKSPMTLPLTTQVVASRAACHQQCWTHPACLYVAYGSLPDRHLTALSAAGISGRPAGTSGSPSDRPPMECQLLGPTAGCSGWLTQHGRLLYRLGK